MNKTQIQNIITPIIGVIAVWLAAKVPLLDQATWNTLITTVAMAVVSIVLGVINRPTSLMDTVASQPGTTVVTTQANATAIPNPDVIAVTPEIARAVHNAP